MGNKARIIAACALALCAIGVDFTSMLMSVVSDLFFIGGLAVLLWPVVRPVFTNKAD